MSIHIKVKVLAAQSCLTFWCHIDSSLPGSSVHGILHVRTLEWVTHSLLQGIFPTQGLNPVSSIAGRFFTFWAIREAPSKLYLHIYTIPIVCFKCLMPHWYTRHYYWLVNIDMNSQRIFFSALWFLKLDKTDICEFFYFISTHIYLIMKKLSIIGYRTL